MTAIWGGPSGEAWKKTSIQIYGWLNFGGNLSSSSQDGHSNYPAAYDERANTVEPDQEVLYIERQPDTVQTDHVDWGFRLAMLYGIDYRFTTAKGFLSHQLLGKNQEYGFAEHILIPTHLLTHSTVTHNRGLTPRPSSMTIGCFNLDFRLAATRRHGPPMQS